MVYLSLYIHLQNQTTVIISVLDVNDNPPVFPQSNYTASVNLTSPLGTQVTSVTATDKDQVMFPSFLSQLQYVNNIKCILSWTSGMKY